MAELSHRRLMLPGPAGQLEALLWSFEDGAVASGPPLAALVCHPHPLYGGTMHSKVVYQTAKTLHRFGLPVLRFNFRGTGLSEGTHDKGKGEADDVSSALDFLAGEFPNVPLLLAGFSFGSWVGLRAGCADSRVVELIGLGLPVADLNHRGFSYLETCDKPKLLVTGEFDSFGPPANLRAMIETFAPPIQEQTTMVVIPEADHFFTGHLPKLEAAIADWLTARHPDFVVGSR